MASIHFAVQLLLFSLLLSFAFLFQRHLQSLASRFGTEFRSWSFVLFFCTNFLGIFTTDLLSMSWFHACELLSLAFWFAHDAVMRPMTPVFLWHHILGIVGLCFQVHIGVGGALMSYLLLDQSTDYVRDRRAFWIIFVLVRFGLYNVLLAVGVRQGLRAAESSLAVAIWVACVIGWWVFSVFYHIRWVLRDRAEIKLLFFPPREWKRDDWREPWTGRKLAGRRASRISLGDPHVSLASVLAS
jgi:hypothetical protein